MYESKILIKPSNFEVHLEKRHLIISSEGRGDTAKLGVTERQVLDALELWLLMSVNCECGDASMSKECAHNSGQVCGSAAEQGSSLILGFPEALRSATAIGHCLP